MGRPAGEARPAGEWRVQKPEAGENACLSQRGCGRGSGAARGQTRSRS